MVNSNVTIPDESGTVPVHGGATANADGDVEDSKLREPIDSPFPPEPSPFEAGEKVLADYNQLVYEAKVQRVKFMDDKWTYFIHYIGWKHHYDEWVGADRLMKCTVENLRKQKELQKAHGLENKAKPGARGKKRKSDSVHEDKDFVLMEKRLNMLIPPALKDLLINDRESTKHLGKLVKLPRSPTVSEILVNYRNYRLKKDGVLQVSVGETVKGLQSYFDTALPAMLLYKNERQQFAEAVIDGIAPSAVYGAEHLLRLFVKLPGILHSANIEEAIMTELQQTLVDFLKFFQKQQSCLHQKADRCDVISIKEGK